jgi:hypothetical protein
MLKRNYFFLIQLLVVMALVFGASAGLNAKGFPACPNPQRLQGPAIRAHLEFVLNGPREDLDISGICMNISLEDPPVTLIGFDWGDIPDIDGDGFDADDLRGASFRVLNTDVDLWVIIEDCFRLDIGTQNVCLKIVGVHNFTANPDGTYSADVNLLVGF